LLEAAQKEGLLR